MDHTPLSTADRAAGAVLGGLIGEALGVGPHWYYDLDEMRAAYGNWIDFYTAPQKGRYHDGMPIGELSQSGYITEILLDSVLANGGYVEADFTDRIDRDLFTKIDGTAMNGPGGYTSQSIREAWRLRVKDGLSWGAIAGKSDTTEAAERVFVLAALYAFEPRLSADLARENTQLTQNDVTVVAMTTAFACVTSALVRGAPLDAGMIKRLMGMLQDGSIPFHQITPTYKGAEKQDPAKAFPSPDALKSIGDVVQTAHDPAIKIEPASKASTVYGLPCAVYNQLPAAYYLAARFPDDYEMAVLSALNGGGQNQARAMLTGALAGAQVGLSGLPERLVNGLLRSTELVAKAKALGDLAAKRS